MLHKLTLIVLLSLSVGYSSAQQDTLSLEEIDTIFSELNPELFNGALLDRSWMDDAYVEEQKWGNYDQIHDVKSFLNMAGVLNSSYIGEVGAQKTNDLVSDVISFYENMGKETKVNKDKIPFGIIYSDNYWIDTNAFDLGHLVTNQNKIIPINEQEGTYNHTIFKSAAGIVFYTSEFGSGELVYDENFIITSDSITIKSLRIKSNNQDEFQNFGDGMNYRFNKTSDTVKAQVLVTYENRGVKGIDTINFVICYSNTTSQEKSFTSKTLLQTFEFQGTNADYLYEVGVSQGCNSTGVVNYNGINLPRIKRPIIIAQPYVPIVQTTITPQSRYDQFNVGGMFEVLKDKGYDIIVLINKPGYKSVKSSGLELAEMILKINEWKALSFPNESWENTIIGFSMGGQAARYALKHLEYQHMTIGTPHHHTRLYTAFDSPHHGANIPLSCQSAFYSFAQTMNPVALLVFYNIEDEASRSMIEPHIIPNMSNQPSGDPIFDIYKTTSRTDFRSELLDDLYNNLTHTKTHTGYLDQRKSFPSFTRNTAITMGSRDEDYESKYTLTDGMTYFEQYFFKVTALGFNAKVRKMYATKYGQNQTVFYRNDVMTVAGVPLLIFAKKFETTNISEWDNTQGGFKTEFYDELDEETIPSGIGIPVGAIQMLKTGTNNTGVQHYFDETSFLPLTSSLAIRPSIWDNNNLYYDPQDEGLMNTSYDIQGNLIESDFYGYPNLGHPSNHFTITPFEAIYADDETYEHIDPIHTVTQGKEYFLDELRKFVVDEVESDVFCLQNYTIGANMNETLPNMRYEAWYKATDKVLIGREVTPKTDIGDFVISPKGDVTVYAENAVVTKPGFHVKAGGTYHAYIFKPCIFLNSPTTDNTDKDIQENLYQYESSKVNTTEVETASDNITDAIKVYPNPNSGEFTIDLILEQDNASIQIMDLTGRMVHNQQLTKNSNTINVDIPSGIYFLNCKNGNISETFKIIIR